MEAALKTLPQIQKKSAYKTLKFWYNVLLETELMDDVNHRKEFKAALQEVKKYHKKEKEQ